MKLSSSGLETSSANSGMTQPLRDVIWTQVSAQIARCYPAYMHQQCSLNWVLCARGDFLSPKQHLQRLKKDLGIVDSKK